MTQATPVRGELMEKAKGGRDGVPRQKFFGLVELDPAGTVLYNRSETESGAPAGAAASDLTGLNFFTEVAPFRNVGEFRARLDSFSLGSQPVQSMDFTCDYEDGPLPVRVLLARIRVRSQAEETKSVLVHIKGVAVTL